MVANLSTFLQGVGQGLGIVAARLIGILVNTPHCGKMGVCCSEFSSRKEQVRAMSILDKLFKGKL